MSQPVTADDRVIEIGARALARLRIRRNHELDKRPHHDADFFQRAEDHGWPNFVDEARAVLDAAHTALDRQEVAPRYRHKKRGTIYVEIGRAKLQAADPGGFSDDFPMVVYRSEADGSLWVRPEDEFDDGRFEPVIADNRLTEGEKS